MFERLGRAMFRHRWQVIGLAMAFVAFGGIWGTQVFGSLTTGGFDDPDSESARALDRAEEALGRTGNDLVVLYRSPDGTVDDPAFRRAVTETLDALPRDVVTRAVTYWGTNSPALVSADRHSTYAVLTMAGDEPERVEALQEIDDDLAAPGLDTKLGGITAVSRDIGERVASDIARAETFSVPVLLVLLVVVFGGVAAACLPLVLGGLAILGAFTALRVLSYLTDVSVFSINVVTILGLGLAIDYGLFMTGRFREEIARGLGVEDAIARTMATAGHTVAVSGVTVAVSLSALLIFPMTFLRSMGFGGLSAVVIAMVAALTVLPALLGILGHRVDALSLRRSRRAPRPAVPTTDGADHGFWYRLAHSIMRRPVIYAVGVLAVLLLAGSPFLRVEFGGVDPRVLPAGTESRVVSEIVDRDFVRNSQLPVEAIVTTSGGAGLERYVTAVRGLDRVTGADVTSQAGDVARVTISHDGDPISAQARELVTRVRDVPAPPGGEVLVGGFTAELADQLGTTADLLPWMALIIVGATFVLLFLAFGSVVLPIKAIVMNVLSLGASFGALVLIFQDGHLAGLLNFTPTGTLEATQPILVLAIVFGLSTDYEVFLMSRIREVYDRTGDNATAVAVGLQRSGRIITSAAVLILVVIGLFSISGITFIKLIGVAMIIAVLVDATIVRALLVPATMRLLGNLNWWAPAPMRRFYARHGLREET
ncbi:MMPL family transporter [Parafrankia sp. FMc2]|uniref:MMPL family transporter n=1 Tax=Parafrankia sp. FMc2 TaxID=3233196 RepID=UPI0034D79AA3